VQINKELLMETTDNDTFWMLAAIDQARAAGERGEVPVGAVLVYENEIIGAAGNNPISSCDPTAHAEILALRQAAEKRSNYRLPGASLYVTLEPCIMCMGALVQARIERLVYGADDPKTGGAFSLYRIGSDHRLNHNLSVTRGVLATQCGELLKDFFKARRKKTV
jgi:tRNA(adenine34) deaminase